jgi:hypothetical protein
MLICEYNSRKFKYQRLFALNIVLMIISASPFQAIIHEKVNLKLQELGNQPALA